MNIRLVVRPSDPPLAWDAFCAATPPFSIALDGYVADGPRFDPKGPRQNFNHHEAVSRLETRATCGQVLVAARQGLFDCFRDAEGPRADVYVNDCDEDVCTAWFLLRHCHFAESATNPLLNRLVGIEDMLDTTAGGYPFPPELEALQELAWVFEPYRRFRITGAIDRRKPDEFLGVITDVEHRIMAHIAGRGQRIPLDTRYERIGGGRGWVMVKEIGAQARTGMFADGNRAYVSVRERPQGGFGYTVGRMSQYIQFPVPEILSALNAAEGLTTDRWGGGDTIGGSPRATGSTLTPDEVARVVETVLEKYRNGKA